MAELGFIDVDHRGLACEYALAQLPDAFGRWGDAAVRNTGARRKTLEFGDVEWIGYAGTEHFVELKLADDFIRSIKSGHMQQHLVPFVPVLLDLGQGIHIGAALEE